MKNKYLILVGDEESGVWTTAVQSENKDLVMDEFAALKEDGTPTFIVYTGDFVTV